MQKLTKNSLFRRFIASILAVLILIGTMPITYASADTKESGIERIHVKVVNNTYHTDSGAGWDGTLVDSWVELHDDSTALGLVVKAIQAEGFSCEGYESGYISAINGISESFVNNIYCGWMGTINDWFTPSGLTQYTKANGGIKANDVIIMQYTSNGGLDIGSDWADNSTLLNRLEISNGGLNKAYDKNIHDYELNIASASQTITINAEALNKNFQVRLYKNTYTPAIKGSELDKNAPIEVNAGDIIYVGVGNSNWLSMNYGQTETVYKLTVKLSQEINDRTSANVIVNVSKDGSFIGEPQKTITVKKGVAKECGYSVMEKDHNGSAITTPTVLDALVTYHQLMYGDKYTKDTAKQYLSVNSSGYIEKAFCQNAAASGFFVNGSCLNDGIAGEYGTTGYLVAEARIADGDLISLCFYADTDYWTDYYTYFNCDKVTVNAGTPFQIGVSGYMAIGAMGYEPVSTPINGEDGAITIHTVNADGSLSPALKDENGKEYTLDADGNATIIFKESGKYKLAISGFEGDYYSPVISSALEVEVLEANNDLPYLKMLNFSTSGVTNWTSTTFNKDILSYNLQLKNSTTSTIMMMSTTSYDADKYEVYAEYIDADNNEIKTAVNNEKSTTLKNFRSGNTKLQVIVQDKASTLQRVYTFIVKRPLDTSNQLKKTTGIVISSTDRELLPITYNGNSEGTLIKLNEDGSQGSAGVESDSYTYIAYVFDGIDSYSLTLTGKTQYSHIRVSKDDVEYEDVANGQATKALSIKDNEKKIYVQVVSDEEYCRYGFDRVSTEGSQYEISLEKASVDVELSAMKNASTDVGNWYGVFDENNYNYSIVIEHNGNMPTLQFETAKGTVVEYNGNQLVKNEHEKYELELTTAKKTINITADNDVARSYTFKVIKKSAYDVPDAVTDYLCIGSQYTNAAYGVEPETTLSGSVKSLGGFGGYITYYYEQAITDNPKNKYGVDFYVYGNSFENSSCEPGQVWVSQDGSKWYALAGSEHYEDSTIKDYKITYSKNTSSATSWSDNYGNSYDSSYKWPLTSTYYMNQLAKNDSIELTGILLPSSDGSINGDGTTSALSAATSFGYADYYKNGTIGADVNPYSEDAHSNGFDLAWAVDESGAPVELTQGVHYIKVVSASNIQAGSFGEKSTEVAYVVRTTAQDNVVNKTNTGTTLNIANDSDLLSKVELTDKTMNVEIGSNTKVNISLAGNTSEDTNIYINNKRVAYGENVPLELTTNQKTVRIIVQQGEKEPEIYVVNLVSNQSARDMINNMYENTAKMLLDSDTANVGSVGGEWKVIGLSRSGYISDEYAKEYYQNVMQYVLAKKSAKLSNSKSSDNSRVVLALASLGFNPCDVAGYNLVEPLLDTQYVCRQGINGAIWAVISLNNVTITGNSNISELIDYILDAQLLDGSFGLDGINGDLDVTAMAIQALKLYKDRNNTNTSLMIDNERIDTAINYAMQYIKSSLLQANANCETLSQTLIGLAAMEINPATDAAYLINGKSMITDLTGYYNGNETAMFSHIAGEDADMMATEQAFLAMTALIRLESGDSQLYDYSDVKTRENPKYEDDNTDLPLEDNNVEDNNVEDNNVEDNNVEDINAEDINTGDSQNYMLYIIIMLCSAAGIGKMYILIRKSKNSIK